MLEMLRLTGEKGFVDTSIEEADYFETLLGDAFLVDIGDADNPRRPVVGVIKYAPGAEVPVHYHNTDYVSIVIEGEIEVTRKRHGVGAVRVVKQGTAYGPLKAGPDGCRVIEVFADRSGIMATFLGDDALAVRYRELQAEVLTKMAEQMAPTE